MESCEIGDEHGPSGDADAVNCSGSCGRTFPSWFVKSSGIILTSSKSSEHRYWFCFRCQQNLSPMAGKRRGSSGRKRTRKMLEDLPTLPPEIWIEIFQELLRSELLKIRLVCRRWRDIVDGSASLRTRLTLKFPRRTLGHDFNPQHLYPASKALFSANQIVEVGSWWPPFGHNLTDITMSYCEIALPKLLEMLKNAPNLKFLELYELVLNGDLSVVADFRLEKLEKFAINGNYVPELAKALSDVCCAVRCLKVNWDDFDAEQDPLPPLEMAGFVGSLRRTLTELNINVAEETLIELVKLGPLKLKKLTLAGNMIGNRRLVVGFCQMHSSLEHLDIYQVVEFGHTSATERNEMVKRLPHLRFLSIDVRENVEENLNFLSHLAKLQSLVLHCVYNDLEFITSDSILSNLRVLHLEGVDFTEPNLRQCLAKIPYLHELTLMDCTLECWPDLLKALIPLKMMQVLILCCLRITDSTRCPFECTDSLNCMSLNLAKITPETLDIALNLCPNLWKLHSNVSNSFDDEILRSFCRKVALYKFVHP